MAEQATTAQPAPQGAPSGPPPPDPFPQMLIMIVGMAMFMYFLVIRPQKKEQQKKEAMLSKLKAKDEVVTFTGIYGQIVDIKGDDVILLVDPKKDVKMRFRRSAIDGIVGGEAAAEEKK
ncbi:MAG TPA: preprotein translocase subunit YajC [Planctomycetota bacterium]|nr:preprotein translocase subunit YajC [Planctomycetota bacterium]